MLGFILRTSTGQCRDSLYLPFRPPATNSYDLPGTEDLEVPTRRCTGVPKSSSVHSELKVLLHGSISNIHCSPFSWDGVVKASSKYALCENEMFVEAFVMLWLSLRSLLS